MKRIKLVLLPLLILLLLRISLAVAFAQVSGGEASIIRISAETIVDEKGDLRMNLKWKIPTDSLYTEIKRNYPNPYMILREFLPQRANREATNTKVDYDDPQRTLWLTADFIGSSVNRKGRWEIYLGKRTESVLIENQKGVFLQIIPLDSYALEIMDLTVTLPKKSSDVRYEEGKGLLSYTLPERSITGRSELLVSVKSKPRLMAAIYKTYGNPEIFEESMWIAKTLFTNTGKSNVRDLKISYKLGDYSEWSATKEYSLLVPGGSVVDLCYPIISPKVTQLVARTPVDLEISYTYKDEKGTVFSDSKVERIEILGINQIEFSNLPPEEKSSAWADNFSNVPLLSAWVTYLDPPVKAFAGMVSQLAGGVPTALSAESATRFCKALYDLEVANGLAYQTPSSFLIKYSPGQDIKYPRDVLRDKSGTCVDLAVLYASVCGAVGLKAILVIVPGHAFPVVIPPDGRFLPIESTLISGPEGAAQFNQALEAGFEQLSALQTGMHYVVDVQEMQQRGVITPELPALEADILQRWGWRLPQ